MSTRTARLVAGVVLAAVVALAAPRLVGDDPDPGAGPANAPAARASTTDPATGLPWVDVSALPPQARDVLDDIDAGGPFDYPGKDGSTFRNYEGVLPDEPSGVYREYTVVTPGSDDRGARRLVTSDEDRDGLDPDAVFWTDDHYDSFSAVRR